MLIPVVVFTLLLFHNMEQNTINESIKSMEYMLERSHDEIRKNVENINMSTQFFLSDRDLVEYLGKVNQGEEISYEEMMNFYNMNISSLERVVNNNPNLYQIRVYVDRDDMEEMMPILYRYDRMRRLSWGWSDALIGWKFDYTDTIFDNFTINQDKKILSLVSDVTDARGESLGVLEVAMSMETMFPYLYSEEGNMTACFLLDERHIYCSEDERKILQQYIPIFQQEGSLVRENGQDAEVTYQKLLGESVIVGRKYVKELGGSLLYIDHLQGTMDALYGNRNVYMITMSCIAILLIIFVNHVVERLLVQFYEIIRSIREVQKGDLNVEIKNCGNDEMGELGTQINKMMERIRQLMEDNLNRERLVKNSEIRALQNQINAHFIYNVLESIKMMAEIDEKYDISDAITSLGKLLRYTMRWTSGNVTVREELEYIRNYLALINLRFDYEIYLSLNLPEVILHQEIPKMSLQPIVENAINHGIEQLAEDTNIYVKGFLEDGDCIIEITDSGKGMSEEQVRKLYQRINGEIETTGGSGNNIGLKNVQDRIQMNFGEKYGLSISSKLGCYTKVQVRVPQSYFEH
ncbi:MAG: histidine kinase [Lachnospiraceae bacterium]|nr:histidine kinase [Lachnospiraceae bacterium]